MPPIVPIAVTMQVGRDALPSSQSKRLAHPQEEQFVQALEGLERTRGRERTCFLLTQALHDLMDSD